MTPIQTAVAAPICFLQRTMPSTIIPARTRVMYALYSQNFSGPIYEKSRVSMLPHGFSSMRSATISQYNAATERRNAWLVIFSIYYKPDIPHITIIRANAPS